MRLMTMAAKGKGKRAACRPGPPVQLEAKIKAGV